MSTPRLRTRLFHLAAASRFRRDERGSIAIIMGLCTLAVFLAVGGAIDYGRAVNARLHLQSAVDSAVLAAARVWQTTSDLTLAQEKGMQHYDQNKPLWIPTNATGFRLDEVNNAITLEATGIVPTPFMSVMGRESFHIKAAAEAKLAVGGNSDTSVEISLILDLTGSMCAGAATPCTRSSKMDPLKEAAKDLIDIVVWEDQSQFYSKVAIVPYSQAVNVGTYAAQVRGSIASGTSTTPGKQNYTFTNAQNQSKTHTISTCVTERTGAQAYTDAPPSAVLFGRNYPGPSNPCLQSTIMPLSNDRTALKSKIDGLSAAGSTGGHIGVGWGWYMLSPNFGYLWPSESRPAAYGTADLKKIAVLMTDGEYNSSYCNGVISKDSTSGSGSTAEKINCNAPNGHSFNQARALCTSMKAAGVEVYTVGFSIVNDPQAHQLINECATSPSHVYNATTGDALRRSFRDIALRIAKLRLTQ